MKHKKKQHAQSTSYLFGAAVIAVWSTVEEATREKRSGWIAYKAVLSALSVALAVNQALQDQSERDARLRPSQSQGEAFYAALNDLKSRKENPFHE